MTEYDFKSAQDIVDHLAEQKTPLRGKQEAFFVEYCANGFNATQAAISSGYSEKTAANTGAENIRKPRIAFAITEFKKIGAKRCGIDTEWVVNEFKKLLVHTDATPQTMNTTLAKLSEFTGGFDANTRKVDISGDLAVVPQGLEDFYADSD